MTEIHFKIEFDNQDVDGFSLADLTLNVGGETFTTKNHCKYKLMFFLTLTDFMDGLSKIYLNMKKEYILLNISSSFYMKFKKDKDDIVKFIKLSFHAIKLVRICTLSVK
ncbi:hypothetical protein EC844_12925 [Acinetobacter calcoaceticus]|uniref:Uncharacterized protein n=1 Tax=Acinetobacter calcoaceticus TaxID=471 RepID=A0A4R1XEV5_ACICA|nr:hypothetical protein EC844_12925 [Acinetobacter calcoaceticus]